MRRYEPHTATSENRLHAAQKLKDFGYRIRFRIDPILPIHFMEALAEGNNPTVKDLDLEDYFALVDKFSGIEPEMVTLGTFRALPPLFNFIQDKLFKKEYLYKNGKRFRMPKEIRYYVYEKLGIYTKDLLGCHIAICKDPSIDLPFSTLKVPCQCMKIS